MALSQKKLSARSYTFFGLTLVYQYCYRSSMEIKSNSITAFNKIKNKTSHNFADIMGYDRVIMQIKYSLLRKE